MPTVSFPKEVRASAAQGAGAVSTAGQNLCLFQSAIFVLVCTAHSGTSPTLDVDIEGYDPTSATWFTLFSFTQSTGATSSEAKCLGDGAGAMLLPDQIRATSTVGGTNTPTKTFSIGVILRR